MEVQHEVFIERRPKPDRFVVHDPSEDCLVCNQQARIQELEEALRPFAEASKLFSHRHVSINPKDLFLWCRSSTTHGNRGITVADVDNAKRVLEGK